MNGLTSSGKDQLRVFPVDPLGTDVQESRFIQNNAYLKNEHQFNYTNIPGDNFPGPSSKERFQLALESGLDEEVNFCLTSLINISHGQPKLLNLKKEYAFLVDYLTVYFTCSVFDAGADNKDLNKSLDAALVLRNLAQDIDNSQVISLNAKIRQTILAVLQNPITLGDEFSSDHYEQCKELFRYTMDIVEAISSYLAPCVADDDLFVALIRLFHVVEDRSAVTTILRSMSRMMYNSRKQGDCPDNIDDSVLNRAVSYLVLSVDDGNSDDELVLTSLDFLYQFAQHSRVDRLLASSTRAAILQAFLPKLLVYKLDYKTEFTQPLELLRLVKRLRDPVPENPPELLPPLEDELNALPEPDRATAWLRCAFEPVVDGEVTQISLWRCYETQFTPYVTSRGLRLLPAVDFIKNVQNAFPDSEAMVVQDGEIRRFVIRGIQPRPKMVPVETGRAQVLNSKTKPLVVNGGRKLPSQLENAMQQPTRLFQYSFNDYLKLNDINTSSSLLLNQLVQSQSGVELFQGKRDAIVDKVMRVPNLLPYVFDALAKIEY